MTSKGGFNLSLSDTFFKDYNDLDCSNHNIEGGHIMFKTPVVKYIAMFIIGFIVMVAVQWLISIIKSTPFQMNLVYNIAMGIFIAALDLIVPADKRKENRKKLMDSFKK